MDDQRTPFESHISYALAAAHRKVHQTLTGCLKQHGVQIEAWRIMELLDGDQRLTMGELAKLALINPPTLSKLVDRMVSDGLVHRQVAAQDHRQVNLLLTDLGRKRMHQVREDVEAKDRVFADALDGEDGKLLVSLLSRLAN
jgi:DNA-binding MarR family transcriptional regulator